MQEYLDAAISISRPTYGDDKRKISIRVEDKASRINFLSLEIDLDKFAEALTGQAFTPCTMEVRGLEYVGKVRETKIIEVEIPKDTAYEDLAGAAYAVAKCVTAQSDWEPSNYFGSRGTFFERDGKKMAKCTCHRWIDKKEE